MINVSTPLPFKQVGTDDGRLVFYFHGVPGAPEEIEVFDSVARQNHVRIILGFPRDSRHRDKV